MKAYYFIGLKIGEKKDGSGNYYILSVADKNSIGLNPTSMFIDEEDGEIFKNCRFMQIIQMKLKFDSNKRPFHQGYSITKEFGSIKDIP